MNCHPCRGTGRVVDASKAGTLRRAGYDEARPATMDCPRCLGVGRVDSRGLAHALEAWRWLRERSREREALARLRVEIMWPHWRNMLGHLFVDVGLVIDTLDEASGGADGQKHTAGHAMWVGRRWAKVTGDMVAKGYVTDRQRRAQANFWRDVCPGVVDLIASPPTLPDIGDLRQPDMLRPG